MIASAIQRVLDRPHDRFMITSLADLRQAYQAELAEHWAEIAAQCDRADGIMHTIMVGMVGKTLRCAACDCPMPDAQRLNRRYCSPRCRQRARRGRSMSDRPASLAHPPPSWADRGAPPPGAWCRCCWGGRFWTERVESQGWRCMQCHPPSHLPPDEVTIAP